MPSVALLKIIMNSNKIWRFQLSMDKFSGTFTCQDLVRVVAYIVISATLTGCSGMKISQTVPNQAVQEDGKDAKRRSHKAWLLSRLPKAEHLAQDILLALHDKPDRGVCHSDSHNSGCDKLLGLLTQRMSQYKVQKLPEEMGQGSFAIIDADTAYIFRMTDWTFSGIADLSDSLYFSVSNVPLRRTDGLSFIFACDEQSDTLSTWSLYQRNITEKVTVSLPVGEYTLTRPELDASGVPKQIDLLTPQQRSERELAKQGMNWQRRTQMEAIKMCSGKLEQNMSKKGAGRGKHNHATTPESRSTAKPDTTYTTMTEALQGKAHLNCKTGSGFVVTPDGIVGEVYRLVRDNDGVDAIISATATETTGGVIRYRYPVKQDNFNVLQPDATKDMIMQIETMKGDSKLELNLRADTGASAGLLLLPGDWYRNPGYRIQGKDISSTEFAALFLRTFRDCAMKDSQGVCKTIPDLFMSFLNSSNFDEFVKYVSSHYLTVNGVTGNN